MRPFTRIRLSRSLGSRPICALLQPPLPRHHLGSSALPSYVFQSSTRSLHVSPAWLAISPFKLHDIGEGIVEVEIIKWHVSEGQDIEEFDPLCEVQSDKSVVELTAHAAGKVKGIRADAGKTVKVGQVLCDIQTSEEDGPVQAEQDDPLWGEIQQVATSETENGSGQAAIEKEESAAVAEAEKASEVLERQAESRTDNASTSSSSSLQEEQNRSRTSGNSLPSSVQRRAHPLSGADEETTFDPSLLQAKDSAMDLSGPSRPSGEAAILPSPPKNLSASSSSTSNDLLRRQRNNAPAPKTIVKASPAVRTLAARLGVDLATVKASGEEGRVTKQDVEAAASGGHAPFPDIQVGRRTERPEMSVVEFGRTRKVMYRALAEQASIPHFGYSHTLNLTPLLPYLKASPPQSSAALRTPYMASDIPKNLSNDPLGSNGDQRAKIGLLSFLIKGLLLALEEHPIMRAKVKEGEGERWLEIARDGVIGVAVSDPKYGLVTPSLPPLAPSTSLSSITAHLSALRQNPTRPTPAANLTISSVGPLGESTNAMPVLPPGHGLAICAVGRAKWEVEWTARDGSEVKKVWDMDEIDVQRAGTTAVLRVPVGWSADHRVLEGAELIAFTESWKRYIEEPRLWLKADG